MNEAPFSWNTFYVDPRGFTCQMTVRAEDGADLMGKVGKVMDWLLEQGGQPADKYGNAKPTMPDGSRAVGQPAAAQTANGGSGGYGESPARGQEWCPIHSVEMKLFQKDGRSWYSHKTDDGKWCRGK